jgi:hypothetical protein
LVGPQRGRADDGNGNGAAGGQGELRGWRCHVDVDVSISAFFFWDCFFVDTVYKVSMFFHGNPLDLTYQESGICGFVTFFFNGIFFLKKNKELIGF